MRSYASALRYWAAWFRLRYRAALALPVPVPGGAAISGGSRAAAVRRDRLRTALVHDLPPADRSSAGRRGLQGRPGRPALNTVLHRLSVLSKAHQMRDVVNPTRDPTVQELVRRIRRAYAARGERPARKTALTKDPLEAMLATCTDGLIGIRDRALLLFGFASGGRPCARKLRPRCWRTW